MDPRTRALRDLVAELERFPNGIPRDVLPELAALGHRISKLAGDEFVQRLIWEHRDGDGAS